MRRKALQAAAVVVALLLVIGAGFRFYTGTDEFAVTTGKKVAALGTEALGTRVEIGGVRVNSLRSVSVDKVVVYDKKNKKLAETETAEVRFSLFSLLFGKSAAAISDVIISQPSVWLEKRDDGKWNYEDVVKEDSEDSGFRGKVSATDGTLVLIKNDNEPQIKETIENIRAVAKFRDKAMDIEAQASYKGETASIAGEIDTKDKTKFDLLVKSDGFDIGKVMNNSPFKGSVAVNGKIMGTADAPYIRGVLTANEGSVYGYEFKNAQARASFRENILTVYELEGEVFNGHLSAKMELETADLAFRGTAQLTDIDTALVGEALPNVSGLVTADLGFKGIGGNGDAFSIFGSISGKGLTYEGIRTEELNGSFAKLNRDIVIDYLAIHFPDNGELGLEGTVADYDVFDLKFYGSHIDLSKFSNFNEKIDIQGHADFRGKLKGASENPELWLEFAAIKGALFKQPFRTLHGEASGSLDGVAVRNFALENGAQDVWTVKGTVGFTGEKRINLQVDTMGARMEDIAALVAPGQPITGNVNNIIMINGTLSNPDITGYVELSHGSYNGYLLQRMAGDYTLKNGIVTVKDFHIFSPLVDMELNGTVDQQQALDMQVVAKDLSLDKYGNKLPYPIKGHGRFEGHIGGTVQAPIFDGILTAGKIDFNGVEITNARGKVNYRNKMVTFNDFGFDQNEGRIGLTATVDVNSLSMRGRFEAKNIDLNSMLAMANLKNNVVNGRFNGSAEISGKVTAPEVHLIGGMNKGDIRGYEIYDLILDVLLKDKIVNLNAFNGKQGTTGVFVSSGKIDLNGPLDLNFSAKGIQAGIITRACGANFDLSGNMNMEVNVRGTLDNPLGEASVEILSGSARGAGFDSVKGMLSFKNQILTVDQFIVDKTYQGHSYKLSAYGTLPLAAFMADKNYNGNEQFNLKVSLNQADMSLLPVIAPGVDWALGETEGSLLLTGTMAQPLIHGSVSLKDGAIKVKELGLPITNMKAQLNFAGADFAIEECSGNLGKGKYQLTGSAHLEGQNLIDYGLNFNADKLEIVSDFYKGPLTANIGVSEGTFYNYSSPKVSGQILIEDATISIPSIPESEGELPEFIVDIGLNLGKKVRFYSPYVGDLRLDGAVHFGGTTKYQNSSGHIAVSRGKIYYLKTPFTVRQGALIFNNAGSFLPTVDFFADTKLDRTKVFLSVKGPIDKMNLKVRSIPEMRSSDIIKLLTFKTSGNADGQQGMDYSSIAEIGLQMAFLSEVEGQVRSLLNLDEFSVSRDWDSKKIGDNYSKGGYNIEMGKYISDKVMLKYIQGVAGSMKRRFGVQYDFNDRISATVLRDEYNALRFGFEARFRF